MSENRLIIRKGKLEDAENCFSIFKKDRETYWEATDFEKSARDDDVFFLVAEENNRVVGYILGFIVPTKRIEATIHETRVEKMKRKQGIGTRLVNAFCEEAFKKGVEVIYAEIEPELLNFYVDACKFEESHEWIEVTKREAKR
jgi:ribosomal protein S18 acetylase RimI-like enzyme